MIQTKYPVGTIISYSSNKVGSNGREKRYGIVTAEPKGTAIPQPAIWTFWGYSVKGAQMNDTPLWISATTDITIERAFYDPTTDFIL